jgi:hypothetical protein
MVFDNSAPAAAPILLASRGKGRPLAYHAEGVAYHAEGVAYHAEGVAYHAEGVAYHAAGVNPVVGRARQDMAAKHTFTHG